MVHLARFQIAFEKIPELEQLIMDLLDLDPTYRPTAEQAVVRKVLQEAAIDVVGLNKKHASIK